MQQKQPNKRYLWCKMAKNNLKLFCSTHTQTVDRANILQVWVCIRSGRAHWLWVSLPHSLRMALTDAQQLQESKHRHANVFFFSLLLSIIQCWTGAILQYIQMPLSPFMGSQVLRFVTKYTFSRLGKKRREATSIKTSYSLFTLLCHTWSIHQSALFNSVYLCSTSVPKSHTKLHWKWCILLKNVYMVEYKHWADI